ncbi:hypothetical protein [Rhodococcus sp. ACS1]|uniref:hypothetical protein n=1 Tax=Rhodococcus sp. ACS1 TaxID=2028570 RepID=UPI0015CCD365|nr:hypothetical protein [Rhodococcus sp. ACS1]
MPHRAHGVVSEVASHTRGVLGDISGRAHGAFDDISDRADGVLGDVPGHTDGVLDQVRGGLEDLVAAESSRLLSPSTRAVTAVMAATFTCRQTDAGISQVASGKCF